MKWKNKKIQVFKNKFFISILAFGIIFSSSGFENVVLAANQETEPLIQTNVVYSEDYKNASIHFDLSSIDASKYEIESIETDDEEEVYAKDADIDNSNIDYEVSQNGIYDFTIKYVEKTIEDADNKDEILKTNVQVSVDGIQSASEEDAEEETEEDAESKENQDAEISSNNLAAATPNSLSTSSSSSGEGRAARSVSSTELDINAFNTTATGDTTTGSIEAYNDSTYGASVKITANNGEYATDDSHIITASALSADYISLDRSFVIEGTVELAMYADGFGIGLVNSGNSSDGMKNEAWGDERAGQSLGIYPSNGFVGIEFDKYSNDTFLDTSLPVAGDDREVTNQYGKGTAHITAVNLNLIPGSTYPENRNGTKNYEIMSVDSTGDTLKRATDVSYKFEYNTADGGTINVTVTQGDFTSTVNYKNIQQYFPNGAKVLLGASLNPTKWALPDPDECINEKPITRISFSTFQYTDISPQMNFTGLQFKSQSGEYFDTSSIDSGNTSSQKYFSGDKIVACYEIYNEIQASEEIRALFGIKDAAGAFSGQNVSFKNDIKVYQSSNADGSSSTERIIDGSGNCFIQIPANKAKTYLFLEFTVPNPNDQSLKTGQFTVNNEILLEIIQGIFSTYDSNTFSRDIDNNIANQWYDHYDIVTGGIDTSQGPNSNIALGSVTEVSSYDLTTPVEDRKLNRYFEPGGTYQIRLDVTGRSYDKYGTDGKINLDSLKFNGKDVTLVGDIAVSYYKNGDTATYYNYYSSSLSEIPIKYYDKTVYIYLRVKIPEGSFTFDSEGNLPYANFDLTLTRDGLNSGTETTKSLPVASKPLTKARVANFTPEESKNITVDALRAKAGYVKGFDDNELGSDKYYTLSELPSYLTISEEKYYHFNSETNQFVEITKDQMLGLELTEAGETDLYAYGFKVKDIRRNKYSTLVQDLESDIIVSRVFVNSVDPVGESYDGYILNTNKTELTLSETQISYLAEGYAEKYGDYATANFLIDYFGAKGYQSSPNKTTIQGVKLVSASGFRIYNPKAGTYTIQLGVYDISEGINSVSKVVKNFTLYVTDSNDISYDTPDRTEVNGASGYIVIPKDIELEKSATGSTLDATAEVFFANYSSATGVKYDMSVDKEFEMTNTKDSGNHFTVSTKYEGGTVSGDVVSVGEINNENIQGNGKFINFTADNKVFNIRGRWKGTVTFYFTRK